tara:strand:- start:2539 stop:2823 length:285 start_codon:yes stop_codon:yes gene_type:complete
MITLSVIASIFFATSCLLFWYCRKLTNQFVFFSENMVELENRLMLFSDHLKGIYELETFYGDETLEGLLKHSKDLMQLVEDFNDNFTLDEEEPE